MSHVCPRREAVFVLPGAQTSEACAPGSTIQPYLCPREHNPAVFVLPGAQSSDACHQAQSCLCSREHKYELIVLPGAQIRLDCAPGSTSIAGLCSREHKYELIVLPGAQIRLDCAPRSTSIAGLCSREHKYGLFLLPGAQYRLECAPGSTSLAGLCSREHTYGWIVLPGAQASLACAPRSEERRFRLFMMKHRPRAPTKPKTFGRRLGSLREQKYGLFLLPGAQYRLDCAPGSTNLAGLCSREHKCGFTAEPAQACLSRSMPP
jgi:translation initiation factor IF-1